jgi:hypothetical protein
MSARSFKIFTGVLLGHLVMLNIVWVGFSAPAPRPPATFTYQGALAAQNTGSATGMEWQKGRSSDQIAFDHFEASYFNRWIELRDLSKPNTYDHLGF